jgi:hypothetical protein
VEAEEIEKAGEWVPLVLTDDHEERLHELLDGLVLLLGTDR